MVDASVSSHNKLELDAASCELAKLNRRPTCQQPRNRAPGVVSMLMPCALPGLLSN